MDGHTNTAAWLYSWATSGTGSIALIHRISGRPATAASSRASSSGVSGLLAQSTSWTPAGKVRAASRSWKIPFCSLIRPTKSA